MFNTISRMIQTGILTEPRPAADATLVTGHLQNELWKILGRALSIRQVDAEIAGDAGCTRRKPNRAELSSEIVPKVSGLAEAVLQAAVLVVDQAQPGDFVLQHAIKVKQVGIGRLGQIAGDASGEYVIEKVA